MTVIARKKMYPNKMKLVTTVHFMATNNSLA